jgi:hypothetical protein
MGCSKWDSEIVCSNIDRFHRVLMVVAFVIKAELILVPTPGRGGVDNLKNSCFGGFQGVF